MPEPAVPDGTVDTPADNAQAVVGSLAVTGWAVDDVGVSRVSIWRDPLPGEPTSGPDGKVFIGDAVQVDGARPDIDAARSQPFDYQSGWGYLLLTNMLPRQGNGTFKLFAYADDRRGPSRAARVEDDHLRQCALGPAVRRHRYADPGWRRVRDRIRQLRMGADAACRTRFPTDGSTIMVYIDGVPVGHPTYNQFRSDIAALFPGSTTATVPSATS